MMRFRLVMIGCGLLVLIGLVYWITATWFSERGLPARRVVVDEPNALPFEVGRESFVTSQACQKCHPHEHQTWFDSYHRRMTQAATPQAVVSSFDDVKLESRGRSYHLQRFGDEFWVTMADLSRESRIQSRGMDLASIPQPPVVPQRVVITTGSHVAQTYWVASESGLWQVPWVYHIADKTWIPNEDSFLLRPDAGRLFNQWNSNCVKCHATGPIPGAEPGFGFRTRVAELGISCEACHGSGSAHVRLREAQSAAPNDTALQAAADPITNPAQTSPARASQICAQCHSSHRDANLVEFMTRGSTFRPGEELERYVRMHRPGTKETDADYEQGYWQDGTCRTGGDEYLGLIASGCFQRGKLSCLSCHSMHGYASNTDQLKRGMEGNQACLQCHESMREQVSQHTHHVADSSGSLCYNCHMPHVTYALFKGIRSHRVDSPNASRSLKSGRPTACNLCHLDRSLGWTAERLTEWYGQPAVTNLPEIDQAVSSVVVQALKGDAMQRIIAAWHMGWAPALQASRNDWQAVYLAQLLDDPYAVVRYVSYRALLKLPGYADFGYDFVADSEQRQEAQTHVIEIWKNQIRKPFGAIGPGLLMDDQQQIRLEEVLKLHEQRDDSPLVIPE